MCVPQFSIRFMAEPGKNRQIEWDDTAMTLLHRYGKTIVSASQVRSIFDIMSFQKFLTLPRIGQTEYEIYKRIQERISTASEAEIQAVRTQDVVEGFGNFFQIRINRTFSFLLSKML